MNIFSSGVQQEVPANLLRLSELPSDQKDDLSKKFKENTYFRILGYSTTPYLDLNIEGHNCNFNYFYDEFTLHHLYLIDKRNRYYDLQFWIIHDSCFSGWTTSSTAHYALKKLDEFPILEYRCTKSNNYLCFKEYHIINNTGEYIRFKWAHKLPKFTIDMPWECEVTEVVDNTFRNTAERINCPFFQFVPYEDYYYPSGFFHIKLENFEKTAPLTKYVYV